jgi:hypothetical protein
MLSRLSTVLLATVLTVGALLALEVPALAAGVNAPPGNSGVEQYLEAIPTPSGNAPARDAIQRATHTGQPGGAAVSASTRAQLRSLGADGKAVLAATALSPRSTTHAKAQGTPTTPNSAPAARAGSPLSATAKAIGGSSGGLGVGLPILLGLTALAGLSLALWRRFRSS